MGKVIAAGIFIVRKDGRLLVCHPTRHKLDFWSIPKGKLDEGESPLQAAIRETYEETNIEFRQINPQLYTSYELAPVNYGHKKKMLYPYLFIDKPNSNFDWDSVDIKCNSNVPEDRGSFPEMDAYKWVTIEEARTILHDTQVACLDRIVELIEHNENVITLPTS
jgi:8-oxo-dGTP pyrophosphatase MutT (NUDIX family)